MVLRMACCSSSSVTDSVSSSAAPGAEQTPLSKRNGEVAASANPSAGRRAAMRSSTATAATTITLTHGEGNTRNENGSTAASVAFPSSIVPGNAGGGGGGVTREDSNLSKKNKTFLQRLVHALRTSLDTLGAQPTNRQLESWACLIHESMSVYGRYFHSVQHVFDISHNADAIQKLAALFHDCIYCNVDGGLLPKQLELLKGVISDEESNDDGTSGTMVFKHISKKKDPMLAMVASVFGFSADQVLTTPFSGENEFLSAVLAVRCLQEVLEPVHLVQVVACIEMTIPFRKKDENGDGPADRLFARLERANLKFNLGIDQHELTIITQRAVDLGNRDVENFCTTDTPWFLDNTWKLLPESNVPLRRKVTYTVCEYQQALRGMCGFFSNLNYKVIFNSFRDSPTDAQLEEIRLRTRRNIQVAKLYIRAKLLSVSLLSALAELTGGDAPMALFVGDMPGRDHYTDRLDDFIPVDTKRRHSVALDDEVYDILKTGRKSDAKFDLANSPLAAYLYGILGDSGVEAALTNVDSCPMGKKRALELLKSLPPDAVDVVMRNCAKIAVTRADELRALSDELSPGHQI